MPEKTKCPLCVVAFDESKELDRKSLRTLVEQRGIRVPFNGTGPDVHVICFRNSTGVKQLIEQVLAEEAAALSVTATSTAIPPRRFAT